MVLTVSRSCRCVADPALAEVAIEDLCWEIARSAWGNRELRRWQRRRLAVSGSLGRRGPVMIGWCYPRSAA